MRRKRLAAWGLAFVMAAGVMAGCNGNGAAKDGGAAAGTSQASNVQGTEQKEADQKPGNGAEEKKTSQAGAEQPKRHVKIYTQLTEANVSYWVWDDALKAYQQEVNPNFTWEVETIPDHDQYLNKLKLYIAGGELPDLFQIPNGTLSAELAKDGKMVNIEEELKQMDMYEKFNKGCLDFLKFDDGSLYLYPDGRYCELFWYWKDTFDQYGLSVPETWDDFQNCCKVLKENDVTPISLAGSQSWLNLRFISFIPWVSGGGEFINQFKKGDIKYEEDSRAVEGVNLMYELASNKYFIKGFENLAFADCVNAFASKQAAIVYTGFNNVTDSMKEAYANGEIGYFQVPYPSDYTGNTVSIPVHTGKAWGISQESYDEELKNFFEYFVNHHTEYAYAHQLFSPLDEEMPSDLPVVMQDIYKDLTGVEQGWISWDDKFDPATIVTSGELAIELSQALITPEEFMKRMNESVEKNAAEYFK